jgi:SAM-dependent methyltransferase
MSKNIKLGNFDSLAYSYRVSRPGYSKKIVNLMKSLPYKNPKIITSLDLGSGTGIFTKEIAKISHKVIGVELSKEMIANSHKIKNVEYKNISVNKLKINKKFDIFSAASCFHWFDNYKVASLVKRSLKQNGYFLVCYNSRDISKNSFLKKVEKKIISLSKTFKTRISSGQSKFVENKVLNFSKISKLSNPFYLEFNHSEKFSKKRYFTVWESSNEFRNKLGKKNYLIFLEWLEKNFPSNGINAEYINKCWLLQKLN